MALDYWRQIAGSERSPRRNYQLGLNLAFIAGAANAGGFLAVAEYTSHMTGIVSSVADNLVLGQFVLALAGVVSVLSFVLGAALCAWLVNWGRMRALKSEYALPLMLEAVLMLLFGVLGARIQSQVAFYVPYTALLHDGSAECHHHQDFTGGNPHHACYRPDYRCRHRNRTLVVLAWACRSLT